MVHEEQQACALAMGADRDARSPVAIKAQRAEQHTAKPTVEVEGISILGALKAQRETQITAWHMVGENAADIPEGAPRPHMGNLAFASNMVVERGVRSMAALVVLRGRLVCASPTVEDAVVIFLAATRVLKGVPCTVKHMVEESDAYLQAARKAQKVTHFLCKGHGGGKRCMFDNGGICPKSVHGGTNFCVAHGGGKRCVVPGCSKSARGKTDCCVRHGGGKRCKFENCGKSAQGSTKFCKAHGGGKQCSWGEGKCEKFARGRSGLCAAHTSLVHGREMNKGGMLGPGLFQGLVPAAASSSSGASVVSDSMESPAKRQQLIPPQVLVPMSMKESSFCSGVEEGGKSLELVGTEGRVHGGGLLSLLGGDLSNAINGI